MDNIQCLFPLKAKVSLWNIWFSDINSPQSCVGAKTLRKALRKRLGKESKKYSVNWIFRSGELHKGNDYYLVYTKENIDFTKVNNRKTVTFYISQKIIRNDY